MQTMHNEDEFVVASLLASDAEDSLVLLSLGSQAQVESNAEMTALLSWTARYLGTEHGEHTFVVEHCILQPQW